MFLRWSRRPERLQNGKKWQKAAKKPLERMVFLRKNSRFHRRYGNRDYGSRSCKRTISSKNYMNYRAASGLVFGSGKAVRRRRERGNSVNDVNDVNPDALTTDVVDAAVFFAQTPLGFFFGLTFDFPSSMKEQLHRRDGAR